MSHLAGICCLCHLLEWSGKRRKMERKGTAYHECGQDSRHQKPREGERRKIYAGWKEVLQDAGGGRNCWLNGMVPLHSRL